MCTRSSGYFSISGIKYSEFAVEQESVESIKATKHNKATEELATLPLGDHST